MLHITLYVYYSYVQYSIRLTYTTALCLGLMFLFCWKKNHIYIKSCMWNLVWGIHKNTSIHSSNTAQPKDSTQVREYTDHYIEQHKSR